MMMMMMGVGGEQGRATISMVNGWMDGGEECAVNACVDVMGVYSCTTTVQTHLSFTDQVLDEMLQKIPVRVCVFANDEDDDDGGQDKEGKERKERNGCCCC